MLDLALAQATLPLLPEYGYPPPQAARLRTNDFIMNNEMKISLATFPSFTRSEAATHDEQKITALLSARDLRSVTWMMIADWVASTAKVP